MKNLVFIEITIDNWQECIKLNVKKEQREFIPDNLYSIAQSKFYPKSKL